MSNYLYQISDIVSGEHYTCLHEPEGWDAYGVTYGRETGISNVVKGYVSQWTFVEEDARWLKSKLFTGGTNRRQGLKFCVSLHARSPKGAPRLFLVHSGGVFSSNSNIKT